MAEEEGIASRAPVNDADLLLLLSMVKRLALSKYPFMRQDGALDPELCATLGRIGGICSRAIEDYKARQPPPGCVE